MTEAFKALAATAFLLGSAGVAAHADPGLPKAEGSLSDERLREFLWGELLSMPKAKRPVVGLALSAGGMRGLAHVGVLQILERVSFPIDVVSGTSMGAMIGSHYASGASMENLWETYGQVRFGHGTNMNTVRLWRLIITDSLLSTKKMEDLVRRQIGDVTFAQLPKRFACVAMDITTGEKIIFREGNVALAVRASMNLPGLFKPVRYRHRFVMYPAGLCFRRNWMILINKKAG